MKPQLSVDMRVRYIGEDITFPNAPDHPVFRTGSLGTIRRYYGRRHEFTLHGIFANVQKEACDWLYDDVQDYPPDARLYHVNWDTFEPSFAVFDSRIEPVD